MNHKAWDIYHLKVDSSNPKGNVAIDRLKELQRMGFETKLVNENELCDAEENLESYERFSDPVLSGANIENIYYPKSEMIHGLIHTALKPLSAEKREK